MQRVFVLDSQGRPLMPAHPARARQMLRAGRAVCVRRTPFTIRLRDRDSGQTQPMRLKMDPGSKTTGLVLTLEGARRGQVVVWAAELTHRGEAVKHRMTKRLTLRRGRRGRKTRYRAPRFDNRTRVAGWVPPSLASRVGNLVQWLSRLATVAPITAVDVEVVRFDTQKLQDPEISGAEYQQGTLHGYEVREYLLEKWGRQCAYCDATGVPLQIEHVVARSRGGSNRVSNLVVSCKKCNEAKGTQPLEQFLAGDPKRLASIRAGMKRPLAHAAAVSSTRRALVRALQGQGLSVCTWSGGRTKYNRTRQGYPKTHWLDAACVGESGTRVSLASGLTALTIIARGRGWRRVKRFDRYGFPLKDKAKRRRQIHGLRTGDRVRLDQPRGKYRGRHTGRLAAVRERGHFDIRTPAGVKISAPHHRFTLIERADGYEYA